MPVLKFVMVVENVFPVAATGVVEASNEAIEPFTAPHGCAVLGWVTSALIGVPVTPRAGLMIE